MVKLTLANEQIRQRAIDAISKLPLEPRQEVIIRKANSKKTLPQIRTVHGWFRYVSAEYAETSGKFYTQSQWKDFFKDMFGIVETTEVMGRIVTKQKSLADYTVKEMSQFMENVDHYCGSELQIFVPVPGMEEAV